jgi:hypothetical protein
MRIRFDYTMVWARFVLTSSTSSCYRSTTSFTSLPIKQFEEPIWDNSNKFFGEMEVSMLEELLFVISKLSRFNEFAVREHTIQLCEVNFRAGGEQTASWVGDGRV